MPELYFKKRVNFVYALFAIVLFASIFAITIFNKALSMISDQNSFIYSGIYNETNLERIHVIGDTDALVTFSIKPGSDLGALGKTKVTGVFKEDSFNHGNPVIINLLDSKKQLLYSNLWSDNSDGSWTKSLRVIKSDNSNIYVGNKIDFSSLKTDLSSLSDKQFYLGILQNKSNSSDTQKGFSIFIPVIIK